MPVQVTGTPAAEVDDLATELGVDLGTEADPTPERPKVYRAWNAAVGEVQFQLAHQYRAIEAEILDTLHIGIGVEYYGRDDRTSTGSQYVDLDGGQPVRGPRDPLNRFYPILDRYRVAL